MSYHLDNTVYTLTTPYTPWQHCIHRRYHELILYSGPPDTLAYQIDNTVYTGGVMNWFYILVHLTHCHTTLTTPYTVVVWLTASLSWSTRHIFIPPWQHCKQRWYDELILYSGLAKKLSYHLDNTVYSGGMMTLFYIAVHLTHCHTTLTTPYTPWQHCIHRWYGELILYSGPPDTLSYDLDNTVYTLRTLYTLVVWWTDYIFCSTWHIVIAAWQHRVPLTTSYTLWQHCIHRWYDELILYPGQPDTLA